MRAASAAIAAAALILLVWAPAAAAGPDERLRAALAEAMNSAGRSSGAYVINMTERHKLYGERGRTARVLASNTKLYTTAAALDRFGPERTLATRARAGGAVTPTGALRGDLYLVGGGDPTFGFRGFAELHGSSASVGRLATGIERAGVTRVTGSVVGDESRYDSLRGGPASGYATSVYVGPLSALSFNAGDGGSGFQSNPPWYAAWRLTQALRDRGVSVGARPEVGAAPVGATALATVSSPPLRSLAASTNKPSNNFFAELLAKELSTTATAKGSTDAGANAAERFAERLGTEAALADGSGLSRANRAAPRQLARFLAALRSNQGFAPEWPAFFSSLAIAGRDGTLADRMRDGAAAGRCHAKTGTLSDVSALSGYCDSRGGDRLAFSFLMNGIDTGRARDLQDRMANALARYRG